MSPRALVAGGAGFLGSHLCDRLLVENWEVTCIDSLATGSEGNLDRCLGHPGFRLRVEDLTEPVWSTAGPFDCVVHLAGLASPVDYLRNPIESLATGSVATTALLEVARRDRARFILASSSEIYGTAQVHPQPETYWGHVNPVGVRSAYDEAKRYAEAVSMAYRRTFDIEVALARFFNIYGPRMRPDDGRVVPTFIRQALRGDALTVHGDGAQTRSLCFVDDAVEAIWLLMSSDFVGPMNIGFPAPVRMRELASRVVELCGSSSFLRFVDGRDDDPRDRCPDIRLARHHLGWAPRILLDEGLATTIAWSRANWGASPSDDAHPRKLMDDAG